MTLECLDEEISLLELNPRDPVHYLDLLTRDVSLPLFTCHATLSDTEKDRFLDLFHRLLNQTAATQTLLSESIVLPLPAFSLLAQISQHEPQRQQTILTILENTLTNWSKQVKVSLSLSPALSTHRIDPSLSNCSTRNFTGLRLVHPLVLSRINFSCGPRE